MIEEINDRMNKRLVNQSVNNYIKSTNWLMNIHIITFKKWTNKLLIWSINKFIIIWMLKND